MRLRQTPKFEAIIYNLINPFLIQNIVEAISMGEVAADSDNIKVYKASYGSFGK